MITKKNKTLHSLHLEPLSLISTLNQDSTMHSVSSHSQSVTKQLFPIGLASSNLSKLQSSNPLEDWLAQAQQDGPWVPLNLRPTDLQDSAGLTFSFRPRVKKGPNRADSPSETSSGNTGDKTEQGRDTALKILAKEVFEALA